MNILELYFNLQTTSAQKRDEPEEKGPSRKKTRLSYTKMIHLQKKGLIKYIQ